MTRDHYGLTPSDWALPQPNPNDPPHYSEARAAGFEAGRTLLTAAETATEAERRFKEAVESLTETLSSGDASGLPRGSSICMSIDTVGRDKKPRAIAVTLWPLEPMTIAEVVRLGALDRLVYERLVREAGFGGFVRMQHVEAQ